MTTTILTAPRILLLHGANLNMLGKRNLAEYGTMTLQELIDLARAEAKQFGIKITAFQSNHEGDLIDIIQQESPKSTAIIINPGAFGHYSYALHDALQDSNLPVVEVHLSNIMAREPWRAHSVIRPATINHIYGKREQGYLEAIQFLAEKLSCQRILI